MHPAALGAFDEAMSSYRDVWLQFYFSQYLWPHFDAWDPERPGNIFDSSKNVWQYMYSGLMIDFDQRKSRDPLSCVKRGSPRT